MTARARVTLRDVAEAAGTSTATVSRALRDDPQISVATRQRVRHVADTLGYVPDAAARSLAVRASRTFGLMVPDATDPIHGQIVSGFERAAHEAGYTVIVANGLDQGSRERRAIREFAAHRADGIAIWGSVLEQAAVVEAAGPSPVVFLSSERLEPHGPPPDLPRGTIRADDPAGIRMIVEHLVAGGRRRIAYAGADRGASNHVRRECVEAMTRELLGEPPAATVSWEPGTHVELAEHLARQGIDAVAGYDDRVALHLLDGFRTAGVRVPDDIAVTGFDDIPFAAISNPRLTTIAQPASEMGALAVAILRGAIATGELAPSRVLPVRLVVRESSGGAAAARGDPGSDAAGR